MARFFYCAQKVEIQFWADFSPVNGKDDTLHQKHFRVHFRRIFKQGQKYMDTMAHKADFRIIKIIFVLIFAKGCVFGVPIPSIKNYA